MYKGLSQEEANNKLRQFGTNELPGATSKNILHIILEVIKEPMFILLLACGSIYLLLGEYAEGWMLLSWVLFIIFITFYQHQKTERALEALRTLSSPRALVIRDGVENRIAARELVPGDLVRVNEGDRIPADGQLLAGSNLSVDESLLTGESLPITKMIESQESRDQHVFSGTLVVRGRGLVLVKETGLRTEFGKIGKSLQLINEAPTNLQRELNILIRNLFIAGVILSTGVIVGFYFTRGNFLESLLNGLATAMAMLPEEFPVVLTVFLAIGSWRLSTKNVLTRKPSAIETLGSATVLCSDKTGTITQNKMDIVSLFTQHTHFPKIQFREHAEQLRELLHIAANASHEGSIDPMEKAIAQCIHEVFNTERSSLPLVHEYPLSPELLAMTRVVKEADEGDFLACCKGSPEAVIALCKLAPEQSEQLLSQSHSLAEDGHRMLGVAKATWSGQTLPKRQQDFSFEFIGFLGFEDPIRPEVPSAIQECYEAGIKVIMITGDYPGTARSIAAQAGMDTYEEVLTGYDLRNISEKELQEKIKSVNIFARIVPEQKLQIIKALKANGEVVAMTGDGVNDAPALKAADIGIAMGGKGTDVARESSSLVLLDDNFSSIVSAIRLGRKIFDNLQKAMTYILAIHIPIIGLTLLPAFFPALPILLMPLHIVFLELIIDPVCSIAFESQQEEKGIMHRPPRNPREQFFGWQRMISSASLGLLLLASIFVVYFLSIDEGHSAGEIRAIAFSALIIGNTFLILSSLSRSRNFLAVLKQKNIALWVILFSALSLLMILIATPKLRELFGFEYPGLSHFGISLLAASFMLLVLEIIKHARTKIRESNNLE